MRHIRRTRINDGWRFSFGKREQPPTWEETGGWEPVTLPHSWNALDTMEPEHREKWYRRGTGWYARRLVLPPLREGDRVWVEVEAAAMEAWAYQDGVPIGHHRGGYTAFTLELSPTRSGETTLFLAVDNSPNPDLIPSDMSDFFLYGGLTRNVWLYVTGAARVEALFFESEVTRERALLRVRGRLDRPFPRELTLEVLLRAPDGTPVWQVRIPLVEPEFDVDLPDVPRPLLWSPDTPHLYRAHIRLWEGPRLLDEVEERLGFRFFDFPAGGPFYLNGERLLLVGTHRHEDWAGRGSAVPDAWSRKELEMIRRAGFNFIRLGHYPQSPAVLDACDELGLIVWEELPWCRGGIGGPTFRENTRRMLVEMIEQHYNHPSIFFWGLGNELDWESEHPDSSDEAVLAFLTELHEMAHRLDPRRLTALRRFEPGAAVVDVYSPSIWSGWYRGRYEDYEQVLRAAMERYPRLLHMEWGGDSHVGRHTLGPHIPQEPPSELDHAEVPGLATGQMGPTRYSRDGDWSESYILDLMEWHIQVQQRLPNLAGTAQWVFKDFGTPLRPENPIPYVNQKGLVDRAARPKDAYYLFASYWGREPVVYVESPTWPVRVVEPGVPQPVRVYSNCREVELFLDGRSLGRRRRDPRAFPAAGLVWQVDFTPGEHVLRAVGYNNGVPCGEHHIRQRVVVGPVGPTAKLLMWTEAARTPDGLPAVRVSVQAVDADEKPVVSEGRRVRFRAEGDCRLWDNRGTPDGSRVIALANGQASILVIGRGTGRVRAHIDGTDIRAEVEVGNVPQTS